MFISVSCARVSCVRVKHKILIFMKNDITLEDILKAITALVTAIWTIIRLFVKNTD